MNVLPNLKDFSDVRIVLQDGSKFDASKFMLATHSPFFAKLFTYRNVQEYPVGNVTSQSFRHILDWIYSRQICLNFDHLLELLRDAGYLDCQDIVEVATAGLKLKISPKNVLVTLMFCRQYNFSGLETWCWNYTEHNFPSVCVGKEFLWLPFEDLIRLLASNKINFKTEIQALNAIIRWFLHEQEERERHLATLFVLLRHSQLRMEMIETYPEKLQDLDNTHLKVGSANEVWLMVKHWHRQGHRLPILNLDQTLPENQPRLCYNTLLWPEKGSQIMQSYNMKTSTWTEMKMKDPILERKNPSILVIGKFLYLIGGCLNNFQPSQSLCRYNLQTRKFKVLSSMQEMRSNGTVVALEDGRILAAGGCLAPTAEMYDPVKNQWNNIRPMREARRREHSSAVVEGKVYVAGGRGAEPLSSVECFDPETENWSDLPSMISRRTNFQLVSAQGQLYALGGNNGQRPLARCERFCFKERKWFRIPDMMTAPWFLGATVAEGKIVVADTEELSLHSFDLENQTWSKMAQYPDRSFYDFTMFDGSLCCVPDININQPDVHAQQLDLPDEAVVIDHENL